MLSTSVQSSTYIYVADSVRAGYSAIEVYLGGVPTEELNGMYTKLIDALKKVAKEGVDMDRMATIIKRDKLRVSLKSHLSGGIGTTHFLLSTVLERS